MMCLCARSATEKKILKLDTHDQECETKLEMHRGELPAANNHEPKIEKKEVYAGKP